MSDDPTTHTGSHARVVAGPGTGKTETLINRTRHLVQVAGADPERILLLTFTNAAGRELRHRLAQVDPPLPAIPEAQTLHSYAFRQLRRRTGNEYVGPRVMDPWEVRQLLCEDLARRVDRTPGQVSAILKEYDAAWRTLDEPPPSAFRSKFESEVERLREVFGFALLGELVYKFKRLLDNDPQLVPELSHLSVDEYQDLNKCDLAVIKELATRSGCEVFVVGDDDQCVYRFRHADPTGIRDFHNDYSGGTDFQLERCHRCGKPVLEPALRLMEHEEGRIPKTIEAVSDQGEFRIFSFRSPRAERAGVAQLVARHKAAGIPLSEILVLVPRANFAADYVEALEAEGVDADNAAEPGDFLKKEEVRRFLYAIRFAADEGDAVAVRGWLRCTPKIGPETMKKAIDECLSTDSSFIESCRGLGSSRVDESLEDLTRLSERLKVPETFEEELGGLQHTLTLPESAVQELRTAADRIPSGDETALVDVADLDSDAAEHISPPDRVRVTTFRKAKGLSATVVVVTDMDDDLVPGGSDDLNEQRRLLYVSLTRARRHLFVTHVQARFDRTRYAGAGYKAPGPSRQRSRFLNEIGKPSEEFKND